MLLNNDFKADLKAAKKIHLPGRAIVLVIAVSACGALLFNYFGKLNLALPTFCSIVVFGFIISVKWKLRRRVWFWVTMAVITALHILLILSLPWTDKWVPAVFSTAIVSVDIYAILWVLSVIGKFMDGPKTAKR